MYVLDTVIVGCETAMEQAGIIQIGSLLKIGLCNVSLSHFNKFYSVY